MNMTLGLTFTYALSLRKWIELGIFDREKKIYEEHLKQGNFSNVIWFTYGIGDKEIRDILVSEGKLDRRIDVVCPSRWYRSKLALRVYSMFLPYIEWRNCKKLSMIKSNQTEGAEVAMNIARTHHIPFAYRVGYVKSSLQESKFKRINTSLELASKRLFYYKISLKEKGLYKRSNISFVSSEHDREYVCQKYHISENKVKILTNYIDDKIYNNKTDLGSRQERFIYVGRISEEKNVRNMLLAFEYLDIGIDVYGDGELLDDLLRISHEKGIDAKFKGKVSNDRLPDIYNKYKYFILCSYHEGMPKSLIEAMACGCVCIGTDVEGINEVIENEENGFLISGTDVFNIRETVEKVINANDHQKIVENSRSYIKENHQLLRIAQKEYEILSNI